ncbi:alpha-galactosidase [Kribbella caucasensis]|uniref:alpha-galactosidase n=1 Tax=Kribbella caucasensis TaxID=2512215 RepID=UPI001EDF065D|nr:alpha-galactosidase [Kribbella sp. VKM Ac-2527]
MDLTSGRLPSVPHWGPDLGDLTAADAAALSRASEFPHEPSLPHDAVRLAVLPEHWTGWVGRPGLSGSRGGRDWSPKFATTALRIDGQPTTAADGSMVTTEGPTEIEVDAVDAVAELALTVTIGLTAGGVLRVRARVTNTGSQLYGLSSLTLALPIPPLAREILDMCGRWGKERIAQRSPFPVGIHLRENRKGRTGADAATVLHAGTPGFSFQHGEIWAVHTGWSGNHVHYAERLSTGEQVIGGGELLLPGEVELGEGVSYTSPWLYGSYGVGLDEVARRFHRFLRARPQHPSPDRPVTINVWEAVYFDHDLERLVDLAERAAALGVERYVLDDGWFGSRRDDHSGLGDWTVSPDIWPDGLHPIVDKVKELGMEFGLWFEPEMINIDSDAARAHPDWVMATGDRLPVESRFQQVINLGIPECYAFVRNAIFAILAEYDIDYIKWDHNRDLVDAGTQPAGRPGVREQTLAFYRLVDEIKAAHPMLEIESCSAGGARVDLGVLERTERVWVSDCIDPHERQQMHRWTTQLIPPELMGAHIASGESHTTGRVHDLDYRAATAVFGHLGIEWDLAKASPAEMEELSSWIGFYKQHRGLLLAGDLVRVDFPDASMNVHGVVAPDRSTAIYSVVAVDRSEVVSVGRVPLRGLDPERRYRVKPVKELLSRRMRPPLWWGLRPPTVDEYQAPNPGERPRLVPDGEQGVELTGAALAHAGLMPANVDPDHAVLYLVTAVD